MITIKERMPSSLLKPLKNIRNKVFWRNHSLKLYQRLEKLINEIDEINQLFPYTDFSQHYVYEPARQTIEHPDIYINQVRYYRMYEYFKKNYPDVLVKTSTIVDVGDTSGIFLKALKKTGTAVNINNFH